MKVSVKIISLIMGFAIAFSCIALPVLATSESEETIDHHSYPISTWESLMRGLSSIADGVPFFDSLASNVASTFSNYTVCANSSDGLHHNSNLDAYYGDGTDDHGYYCVLQCDYCDVRFKCYADDLEAAYNNYVSTLDSTEASYTPCTNFSVSKIVSGVYTDSIGYSSLQRLFESSQGKYASCIKDLGVNDRVLIFGISSEYFFGLFWNSSGRLSFGAFTNPYGSVHSSYFGVYDLSSLQCIYYRYYTNYYHSDLKDVVCGLYPDKTCYVWTGNCSYFYKWSFWYKPSTDSTFNSSTSSVNINTIDLSLYVDVSDPSNVYYIQSDEYVTWNTKSFLSSPTGTDETSRYGYLMHLINNYNTNNSYQTDPNAVNVYISKDDFSDLYSMNMFSEETLIFTEPETGAQYQCENWTYDYNLRSYALDLVDGSMTYNGSAVDGVTITYGDDAVTIRGWAYGSSSTLSTVYEDTYNYVAVSQSECALFGHSYDHVETPATCTNYGESVDTCTVCGETDREIIPALGHDLVQSVLREPSCSLEGVTQFDCSRCDYSYTGSVPMLSHDFQPAGSDSDGNSLYVCSVCGLETTDYTGEGPITDEVGWWSWLQGWLADFKEWLGEQFEGLGDTIENSDGVVIDQDVDVDYNIVYTDPDGVEQETSIMQIMDKFAFLADIYDIGDTMLAVVQADAVAAYAVDDGGSSVSSGAPTIVVDLSAANSKYGYVYGGSVEVLDLSWYAPYKERVDSLVSGFLWLLFLWGLFKSAPAILGGVGLTENHMKDIGSGKKRRSR